LDFNLKKHVYCHDLQNPPSQSGSCNVAVTIVNSTGLMSLERVNIKSAESVYLITIPSGNNLGFTTSEQSILENDFSNFVLALNLTQRRIGINKRSGVFQPYEITPKVPEPKTTVTKSNGGYHHESEETVVFRDESYFASNIWGQIDENKVVKVFQKILKLGRFEKKDASELLIVNLNDALSKYESGISEFDRLVKFKHFFNSLDLVTNMVGTELKGKDFDREVERISSVSESDAKEWREFYNRTKHVQKDSDDIDKYYNGADTLTLISSLLAIRTCLNDLLISKL
jgi:hypothetical protein